MQLVGKIPEGATGQLFWSQGGAAVTETSSAHFVLASDGTMHTFELELAAHRRWFGRITLLRFDPCSLTNVDVVIDDVRLLE